MKNNPNSKDGNYQYLLTSPKWRGCIEPIRL